MKKLGWRVQAALREPEHRVDWSARGGRWWWLVAVLGAALFFGVLV